MDKLDFMNIVKDILEETPIDKLDIRANEMKSLIDKLVNQEKAFDKAGIR